MLKISFILLLALYIPHSYCDVYNHRGCEYNILLSRYQCKYTEKIDRYEKINYNFRDNNVYIYTVGEGRHNLIIKKNDTIASLCYNKTTCAVTFNTVEKIRHNFMYSIENMSNDTLIIYHEYNSYLSDNITIIGIIAVIFIVGGVPFLVLIFLIFLGIGVCIVLALHHKNQYCTKRTDIDIDETQ